MRTMIIRERLTRSLNARRARRSSPPAAGRPCSGPCGCEEVAGSPVAAVGRARAVEWPGVLDAATATRLADRIEASGMLDDPDGWTPVGDVDVRVLSGAEVDALLAEAVQR